MAARGNEQPAAPDDPGAAPEDAAPAPGRVRRAWDYVCFPEPVDAPLFTSRRLGAAYLGAWGLTATHLVLWVLLAVGLLAGEALTIGVSVLSFLATCLLVGMVVVAHQRFDLAHPKRSREIAAAWWRGPWDPVGRLVWLPVRLPDAWRAVRHGAPATATSSRPDDAANGPPA